MICCLEESYVGEFLGRVAIVTVIVIVGVDRGRALSGKWAKVLLRRRVEFNNVINVVEGFIRIYQFPLVN